MAFAGKTVWVTGATSGIGEALARGLGERGAAIVVSGRRKDVLDCLACEIAEHTLALPFEATDYAALPDIAEQALAWRDGVDILINNAGVSQRSLAVDTGFEVYRELMEIDFFAPLRLTQLVLPHMIAQAFRTNRDHQLGRGKARRSPAHRLLRGQARLRRLFRGAARRGRDGLWRRRHRHPAGIGEDLDRSQRPE